MVLQGKTAIITGAASGIGRATAVRFAQEGANLAIIDLNRDGLANVEAECTKTGAKILSKEKDASNLAAMDEFVAETARTFGGIDILVNTIVHRVRSPFLEVKPEDFRQVLEVNVTSYYFLTQKVVPHMIERGGGSVVHISSQLGFVAIPDYSPYCTSKGAVIHMTRALAFELADRNIRVNSVAPGPTDTPGVSKGFQENPQLLENLLANVPMHRLGRPEEIADTCLFLASDAASYITGHNLVVDGGYVTH
jgi:NAD(P)-dependent dehydrogenase (short-subunit alcohol dehydrogenase family)